ncbi:MAG: aminotransferase class I/II-fold pyridoxal phosphate-dependent enzyme [Bacteroidia bacterium]|nr:aminotransferase class I/II-fold pyridoxal phosphate-dependent enzyme [Bacteroidia bacterium]
MYLRGNEWEYLKACLDSGWISSAGAFTAQFEQAVAAYTGASCAVAVSSGTAALHLGLLSLGAGPGDYVITSNLTYVATANAIRYTGAEPIFVDIDAAAWQMDLALLEEFLHTRTELRDTGCHLRSDGRRIACLLPVHALGWTGDLEVLMRIAAAYRLPVLEDAADAMGARFAGRHVGTFGQAGCLSFNGNKIITAAAGGMVLTSDPELARRAHHLSVQAKAAPEDYFHDDTGYNYRMPALLAALGMAQLEQLDSILALKRALAARYAAELGPLEAQFPDIPPACASNHWLVTVMSPQRDRLLKTLQAAGQAARPVWWPLNRLPMFQDAPYISRQDQAYAVHRQALSLPSDPDLSEADFQAVIRAFQAAKA